MDELECLRTLDEHLRSVEDETARVRIASWIAAKYLGQLPAVASGSISPSASSATSYEINNAEGRPKEIPGIAKLSQSGELQLTVRDFKAKSANDAAVRLVHVVIWASSKLTGETTVSSKNVIVPLLRKYRCYDGNTRGAIASNKGLVRDADSLSLDFHAEQYADKVVAEILDATSEGKWKPGSTKRRQVRSSRSDGSEA